MAQVWRCQKRAAGAPGRVVDEIGYESKERGVRWWQRGERRVQVVVQSYTRCRAAAARPSFEVARVECGAPAADCVRTFGSTLSFFVTRYSQKPLDWCCPIFLPASRIGRCYNCVTVMC
jgi:hypothetical protein